MKKYLLSLIFIGLVSFSFGQISKGSFLIMGSSKMDFSSSTSKLIVDDNTTSEIKQTNFNFSPALGYFVIDQLAVGGIAEYSSIKTKVDDNEWGDPQTGFQFSVFGRYYFLSQDFTPYAQLKLGYASQSSGDSDIEKYSGTAYGISGGASYFINEHVGFDVSIGYDSASLGNKERDDIKIHNSNFGFRLGVLVSL